MQNCIFLLGDSREVTHRIASKFCDDKKDTLLSCKIFSWIRSTKLKIHAMEFCDFMEPTTVGSLWLENDLHENELEFESYMGRSKKNVRVTSDGIHAEIHEIWTCVAPAAPPLFHAAVNPCLHRESAWNWSCNSVNLGKSTVTWMRRHYVFTVISRWSTFSSTVNVCNINCVIFSDTHCSFGPPILWHGPFHAGVSVY